MGLNHRSTEAAGHAGIGELKVLLLTSRASSLVSAKDYCTSASADVKEVRCQDLGLPGMRARDEEDDNCVVGSIVSLQVK